MARIQVYKNEFNRFVLTETKSKKTKAAWDALTHMFDTTQKSIISCNFVIALLLLFLLLQIWRKLGPDEENVRTRKKEKNVVAKQLLAERPRLEVGPTKNLESKEVGDSSVAHLLYWKFSL